MKSIKVDDIFKIVSFALIYFVAHEVAFLFPDSEKILTAIWPAGGIALAALLLNPKKLWLPLIAAFFLAGNSANLLAGRPLFNSLGFMIANVLESAISAFLITFLCRESVKFNKLKEVIALLIASTVINAGTAFIGAGTAYFAHISQFWQFWVTWWVADGLGILLITPFIVVWLKWIIEKDFIKKIKWVKAVEYVLFIILWLAVIWVTFNKTILTIKPQPYLLIILIGLAALRFSMKGMTFALIIGSIILITSGNVVSGPLIWGGNNLVERLLHIQLFLGVIASSSFMFNTLISERKKIETDLFSEKERLLVTLKSIGDAVIVTDTKGNITLMNYAAENLTEWSYNDALGLKIDKVFNIINEKTREKYENPLEKNLINKKISIDLAENTAIVSKTGKEKIIKGRCELLKNNYLGETLGALVVFSDITKNYQVDKEHKVIVDFLKLLNTTAGNNTKEVLEIVIKFLKTNFSFEAIGIRLKEGDDYPYYVIDGFTEKFVQMENSLCEKDLDGQIKRDDIGNPVLECMCGNILCGRFDPSKPFFTVNGSFWSNCTTDLLASTTEKDRQSRTRNRCNGEGYESVALIPIRHESEVYGLIQMNDKRKGMFSYFIIELLERIAFNLAKVLSIKKSEEDLRKSEKLYHSLFDNMMNGYAYCQMHYENGLPVDWTYITVNHAFETLTGLKNATGKKVTELIPGIYETSPDLFENYSKTALTGIPSQFESYVAALDMWFSVTVYSPKKEYFVVIFDVITERKKIEKALKESEERYRELFDNISSGVAIYDAFNNGKDFIFKDINKAGLKTDNIKKENTVGKNVLDIRPGIQDFGLLDVFKRVWETGQPEYFPASLYKDNNLEKWYENFVYKLSTNQIVAVYDDVTERKLLEIKEKERIKILNILTEASFALNNCVEEIDIYKTIKDSFINIIGAFFIVTVYDDINNKIKIIGHNMSGQIDKIITILGKDPLLMEFSMDDMTESEMKAFITGKIIDYKDGIYGISTRKIPKPIASAIEKFFGIKKIYTIGFSVRNKPYGGVTFFSKNEFNDQEKYLIETLINQASIAIQRKKAEKSIIQASKNWQTTFDAINDHITLLTCDNEIIEINKAALNSLNMERNDVIGKKCFNLVHNINNPIDNCPCFRVIKEKVISSTEYSENNRVYEVVVLPVLDDAGNIKAMTHVAKDITERKAYEQKIKSSLSEKEVLLKELYHRTKNNMQVIYSMIGLKSLYADNQEIKNIFREIGDKIQSMSIVHQMLYKSHDLSSIDIKEYVTTLVNYLMQSYKELFNRVKINFDIENLPVLIDIAIPLGLIINELMSNSFKYAFPNNKKGEINLKLYRMENDKIEFIFSDNGIGLSDKIDFNNQKTLGIQTVIVIGENQLQGKVDFKSEKDSGFTCKIVFSEIIYKNRV